MTIITPCGNPVNDSDCMMCLKQRYECKEAREALCQGCIRTCCSSEFKRKRVEQGMCRGRELAAVQEFTELHGKGI